jgi:hypothetical protein
MNKLSASPQGAVASMRLPGHGSTEIAAPPVQSHISDGHRLLKAAGRLRHSLYGSAEFSKAAAHLPASYFLHSLVPAVRAQMNRKVASRVTAAISRARRNSHLYDVKHAGVAEYVAEALCDNTYFKQRQEHVSRVQLRDRVAQLLQQGAPVDLILPIFSRKPASPLKNRGGLPDLAEVASLAQLAGAAQVASALSPTGCRIHLLADGHKYRRACNTPAAEVDAYQQGLGFWIDALSVGNQVQLVDYEASITPESCGIDRGLREHVFNARAAQVAVAHSRCFFVDDIPLTLARLEAAGPVGSQVAAALASLLTSVNYRSTGELARPSPRYDDDGAQALYTQHIAGLQSPLQVAAARCGYGGSAHYLPQRNLLGVLEAMRREAWEAAVRYVAISLTDRELQVVRRRWPQAIKLTIHAKPGELHCISTSRRNVSMTAQHCTGGIHFGPQGAEMDFRYRVEREAEGQVPVMVAPDAALALAPEQFGPLAALQASAQPFMYTNDDVALQREGIAEKLMLGDVH